MKPGMIPYQQAPSISKLVFLLLSLLFTTASFAQYNVTEIITDYNGYWKSSAASNNSIKPDNSHNLLSFSFNGIRYSTGVNDALLSSKGQSFTEGDYRSLQVTSLGSAATSNTKIGVGYLYDGNANGAGSPPPANDIPYYLTDGSKGLDLGTCVANLPAGTLTFPVAGIETSAAGDGVPDILITQIADPSGSQDRYEFTDINGAVVGNYVDIVLTNIPPVGNWTADFYEASQHPMTLTAGFTKTDRPIRLWATDVSAFGINSSNASRVAYFRILLSGNSDVAFVAYNIGAVNIINNLLPVRLTGFSAKMASNSQVQLDWETGTELNSSAFTVERSADGTSFISIAGISAAGNAAAANSYGYTDRSPASGKNYYRLKITDKDGQAQYSQVIVVNVTASQQGPISIYPNPSKDYIIVNHPFAGNHELLQITGSQGQVLLQQKITAGSFQTQVALSGFAKGVYQLLWTNGKEISCNTLVIR